MTLVERKRMIVGAIRKLEDHLILLKYCEVNSDDAVELRNLRIDAIQQHLRSAHSVLTAINEEELAGENVA